MSKAATVILKNKIDKQHITGRSAGYGQRHIFLPDMKSDRQSHRQKLGNPITFGREINSFKAINHQHSEYRSGKGVSEISDVFRSRFFPLKIAKGKKRVSIVPTAQRPMVIICCAMVIPPTCLLL